MIRWLSVVGLGAAPSVGMKAARLGELITAGFAVPRGFVVPCELFDASGALIAADAVKTELGKLGDVAVAVRSSAVDEDSADASFAGIYDSVLDVRGEAAVLAAIARVQASARSARARAYRGTHGPAKMAVIVQQLVRAQTAGVAFTADPVTGARDRRVISVVKGLGEALVSGDSEAEEWVVEKSRAQRRRSIGPILQERRVMEIARVAQQIADKLGAPQDVEWAIGPTGELAIVQARPITALPDSVEWKAPARGAWMRNFRYGEWLADPVSPLFATWFLARAEDAFLRAQKAKLGISVPKPSWIIVNGWYYHSPMGAGGMGPMLGMMLRAPLTMLAFLRMAKDPFIGAKRIAAPRRKEYDEHLRPANHALAARGASDRESAIAFLDELSDLHGELLFNMAMVGGFAWKAEMALATFFRQHLATVDASPQLLVTGLSGAPESAPHLASSLDWMHPTFGEIPNAAEMAELGGAFLHEHREELEARCREALAERPKLLARFDAILALARDYAVVRELQASEFTLAWPAARAALRVLGEDLVARGVIAAADDIHFMERSELDAKEPLHAIVGQRRARWQRQRKLAAPLSLGELPGPLKQNFVGLVRLVAGEVSEPSANRLVGMPASPGRATGSVRIIRTLSELDRFHDGEILVAPTTPPGWTPLLGRALAVVTDGGSLAAHASLVAREYGIPAVVATHDATHRLHDGQLVTVDGTRGIVDIEDQ